MTLTAVTPAAPASVPDIKIDPDRILEYLKLNPKDPKAQALVLTCRTYGLDPLLKHAVLIQEKKGEANLYVTRDGLLHIAHRSGVFDGIEVLEQGETDTHHTARVAVYRRDWNRSVAYPGRFPKMRPVFEWSDGPDGRRVKTKVGEEEHPYGPEMAIKVAESMALRRAFDVALSVAEERWDLDDAPAATTAVVSDRNIGVEHRIEGPHDEAAPVPVADAGGDTALMRTIKGKSRREKSAEVRALRDMAASDLAGPDEDVEDSAAGGVGEAPPAAGEMPDWLAKGLKQAGKPPEWARGVLIDAGFGFLAGAAGSFFDIAGGDIPKARKALRDAWAAEKETSD